MSGLMDLFSTEDFNKEKKGKKDAKGKGEKKGKQETAAKGIRYPLPVRVSAGHIRCLLTAKEFGGKTVGEADVKKKIREQYPELAGVQFNLVKFSNSYTGQYEKNNGVLQAESAEGNAGEESGEEKSAEMPLDFAAAETETVQETPKEEITGEMEEPEEPVEEETPEKSFEEDEDAEDSGEDIENADEEETTEDAKKADSIPATGCWIKLDICYEPVPEEQKIPLPVMVKAGDAEMEFTEDADSLSEIREGWVVMHPEYSGCLFHYDDKQNILIPFVRGESEIKGKKYPLPIKVGYLDDMVIYEAKDFGNDAIESVTQEQIRKLYAVKHPEFDNAIFSYEEEMNCLFPVMNFKKTDTKEKYSLPIKIRGYGFVMDLVSSDFGGKTAVTLEEVRDALEEVYPEFSKERTEMIYDERGFIIPVLKGSKKGITITSTRKNQNLYMVQGRDGSCYRIEQMPYGCFDCREDGSEVDFHLSAQKIPGSLFYDIFRFFRKNPCREAAAQIFYDDRKGAYELHFPRQRAGACSVVFDRDVQMEEEKVLVMDVHSHGRMDAFFSSVDNHDEKGTRLFLVLGRIDRDVPAWKLRAGIAGNYRELALTDVFEMEEIQVMRKAGL